MPGIERARRPQTNTRVLTVEEQQRRAQQARLRQFDRAMDDLLMDPDEWLDVLLPDRPDNDTDTDTDEENP